MNLPRQTPRAIKRALISVSDKSGIVDFARQLAAKGVEIVSTGGTYKLLASETIAVREVAELTQFPEMMDGRVKTLHPKIHGAILGRRGQDDEVMNQQGIEPIDLVVVNLYPFTQTIARHDCDLPMAIENIDIGGPTMVRAAAKNHCQVGVVVNSSDYQRVLDNMTEHGNSLSDALRFDLAVAAFEHTACYDSAIANYLVKQLQGDSDFGRSLHLNFEKQQDLRYGENPHQQAAFYREQSSLPSYSVTHCQQLMGRELSFNNINDGNAAIETVNQFADSACVIVKHANPCGVAIHGDQLEAYQLAYTTDKESAFGGIIAFNRPLQKAVAQAIIDQQFVELIVAPAIEETVLDILSAKQNVRLLVGGDQRSESILDYKRVNGGLLVQQTDVDTIGSDDCQIVSERQPTDTQMNDLLFAWKVAKMVKSNAIVYARQRRTIGVGAGQMSRVNAARIAAFKAESAGLSVVGAVLASDAFFPFRDAIDSAAEIGIEAIIQPGGSMRDQQVIDAVNQHNMVMLYTGIRHFNH